VKTDTRRTPAIEEIELEKKREELDALKRRLARLERIAANLRLEIGTIGRMYSSVLDPKIRERNELEMRLSQSHGIPNEAPRTEEHSGDSFSYNPHDVEAEDESTGKGSGVSEDGERESFKELYRRVAKTIHPDLSTNEEEKKWRQRLMAEANSAYAKKDRKSLRAILRQWEDGPVSRQDRDFSEELTLVLRDISWVLERTCVIEAEIDKLKKSGLYLLLQEIEKADSEGIDLLDAMVRRIDEEILSLRNRLRKNHWREKAGTVRPEHCEFAMREVRFPTDASMGRLFIRKAGSESFLEWQDFRDACGVVSVPAGTSLRLDVREKGRGMLSSLTTLKENDLQALFLHGSNDRELFHIQELAGLRELYLSGKKITDAGLKCLKGLNSLHRLYLYDTSVTDQGTETLGRLRELRCITFCGSDVSEAALNLLKSNLPRCRIVILNSNAQKSVKNAPEKS
jgi:hypothetical protein